MGGAVGGSVGVAVGLGGGGAMVAVWVTFGVGTVVGMPVVADTPVMPNRAESLLPRPGTTTTRNRWRPSEVSEPVSRKAPRSVVRVVRPTERPPTESLVWSEHGYAAWPGAALDHELLPDDRLGPGLHHQAALSHGRRGEGLLRREVRC